MTKVTTYSLYGGTMTSKIAQPMLLSATSSCKLQFHGLKLIVEFAKQKWVSIIMATSNSKHIVFLPYLCILSAVIKLLAIVDFHYTVTKS